MLRCLVILFVAAASRSSTSSLVWSYDIVRTQQGLRHQPPQQAAATASPPVQTATNTPSRRQALLHPFAVASAGFLFGSICDTPPTLAAPAAAKPTEETPEELKARQQLLMKERIAASKKNYRKADSYAKERFETVDYSCVADTGSPCKEPKKSAIFPSDEKIARDGKL